MAISKRPSAAVSASAVAHRRGYTPLSHPSISDKVIGTDAPVCWDACFVSLQVGLGDGGVIGEAERIVDVLLDVGVQSNITPLLPLSPLSLGKF